MLSKLLKYDVLAQTPLRLLTLRTPEVAREPDALVD